MEAYLGALRRVALFHGMGDRELLSMLDCLGARGCGSTPRGM